MSDPLIEGMTLIYAGKRHTVFEVPALLNATVLNIGEMMADLADVLHDAGTVSYTHTRAHETTAHLVCHLLLKKKKTTKK